MDVSTSSIILVVNDGNYSAIDLITIINSQLLGSGLGSAVIGANTLMINSTTSTPCAFSGTTAVQIYQCQMSDITTSSTTQLFMYDSSLYGAIGINHGSSGTISLSNVTINTSHNPALNGAGVGVITLSNVNFVDNSAIAGTLTLTGTSLIKTRKLQALLSVRGQEVIADGDSGAGIGSTVQITNVIDETLSTGVLTIHGKTVNIGNNSGFLKIRANSNIRYIPYFTTISP